MSCATFEAPKIKLRRAKRHIVDLEKQIADFLKARPFRAVVESDGDGRQRIVFRVARAIPKDFSAIIGDVIHNLRAALDLLACDLVRLNGGSDEDVYFPFCEDANYLETMIKKRHVDRAAPQAVDLIRSLQPYRGGNQALRAIHDLDIRDKHQMLIPIANCAGFGNAKWGGINSISVVKGALFGPVEENFSPFAFPTDPKLKSGQEIPAAYKLTFSPLDPLGPGEIIPVLHRLAKLVASIIESFESLGLTQPSPAGGAP
jgi:hypothetical protein